MNNIRESSQQDRRVYVGNLSYDVKWHHLKDFMRQAGEVLYADVLLLPDGMSKLIQETIIARARGRAPPAEDVHAAPTLAGRTRLAIGPAIFSTEEAALLSLVRAQLLPQQVLLSPEPPIDPARTAVSTGNKP